MSFSKTPQNLLSKLLLRLSPMTKMLFSGTVTGLKSSLGFSSS
jgi:hypothetical protein